MTVKDTVITMMAVISIPVVTGVGIKTYKTIDKCEKLLDTGDQILVCTDKVLNKSADLVKNVSNSFTKNSDDIFKPAAKIVNNFANLIEKKGVAGACAEIASNIKKAK